MPPEPKTDRGRWEPYARVAAKAYGIDESFFVALLNHENPSWNPLQPSYDEYSPGHPKSIGIGQFTEETARGRGIPLEDRKNPERIIPEAAKMVSELSRKYDKDWWKIYAAYNAGEGAVDKAVDKVARSSPFDNTPKDWREVMRNEAPAYRLTIDAAGKIASEAQAGAVQGPEVADFMAAAGPKYNGQGNKLPPAKAGPPDLNDDIYKFQLDDGTWARNSTKWAQDTKVYWEGEKLRRDAEEGPASSYYDDVIKSVSADIAAGKYGLEKAKEELDTRTDVYKTIVSNAANLLQYAVPEGSQYWPGGEPGGFYSRMGVPSSKPVTTPIDLFGMGNAINTRNQELMAGLPNVTSDRATQAFNSLYPNGAPPSPSRPSGTVVAPPPGSPVANPGASGGIPTDFLSSLSQNITNLTGGQGSPQAGSPQPGSPQPGTGPQAVPDYSQGAPGGGGGGTGPQAVPDYSQGNPGGTRLPSPTSFSEWLDYLSKFGTGG